MITRTFVINIKFWIMVGNKYQFESTYLFYYYEFTPFT